MAAIMYHLLHGTAYDPASGSDFWFGVDHVDHREQL